MPSSSQEQTEPHNLAPQLERLRYHCHSELLTWISLMTPMWLTELQCAKVQQSFLLCLYSKNTGKRPIAFGNLEPKSLVNLYCSSEEDIFMPMRMVHSWEVCDMGCVLLQQKGPPCSLCWLCSRSPVLCAIPHRACVISKSCLWGRR